MLEKEEKAETMKCVLVSAHGTNIEEVVSIGRQPRPKKRKTGELLVEVHTAAFAVGDYRVMKGSCSLFQAPKKFPYIPGGDFAGVVEEADESSRFHEGDEVIVFYEMPAPFDAMAEYAVVNENRVEIKPKNVSWLDAPCITTTAVSAVAAAKDYIKEGSRILILGGSGGVGTVLIQLAKLHGAAFIATTSTETESSLKELGADYVIDYTKVKWWEIQDFEDSPFDVIFDLGVGGMESWNAAKTTRVIKKKTGNYVAFNPPNSDMQIKNIGQLFAIMVNTLGRSLISRIWPSYPRYTWFQGLALPEGRLQEVIDLFVTGKLKIILDPVSPLPFTKDGIIKGFQLMKDRKAHGKVVVQILKQ